MRLGAPVFHCANAEEWAAAHAARGYGAAYWPLEDGDARQDEYVEAAARHGLVIAEVGVWNNMLSSDPDERARNVAAAVRRLKTADQIGARCCVNISGSRGARWDGPHPDNLTRATFCMAVDTVRRVIGEAAPTRTRFALEPMPWMYPDAPESALEMTEAVNSPAFGVHVDMCNLINSYDRYRRHTRLIDDFFDLNGANITSVHAKDCVLRETLTLHIDETIPGRGAFDFDTLLRRCACLEDVPIMAEHLSGEQEYREATDHLRAVAVRLGLHFDGGTPA